MDRLVIRSGISIPMAELRFTFDRSPGPGGQNVNKLNTRAELRFDVAGSPCLSEPQRQLLRRALGPQLTTGGELVVRSSRYRSQFLNRQDCIDKLTALLNRALRPLPPRRRPTRPTRSARLRRLERKRRHSQKKAARRRPTL